MATGLFSSSSETTPDPLLEQLRSVTIGLYEVRGELGRGGMAIVYLAKDIRLERTVAIKVMLPELLRTEGMAERFLQEARISARLEHQNIIVVHDVQHHGDLIYFVMAFVDGCGLDEICHSSSILTIDQIRWLLLQAAQALSYANGEGIVHRDVKPANILLNVKGDVIVTDFGIAKVIANHSASVGATMIGTPLYMSPEQVTGQQVSEASDQYSLGVTAYTLLAGGPPFSGDLNLYDLQTAHVRTRPVHVQIRRPDCPPALASAVMRMLEKRPSERWPSLQDLVPVLGEGLAIDGREVKGRLAKLAIATRDANAQRMRLSAVHTPVTPRPDMPRRPKPSIVVVSPPSATVFRGSRLDLSATVMTSAGDTLPDAIVAWTSSDNDVATVSPDGCLTAVGPGTARIRAAIASAYAETLVSVALSPITRLELSSETLTLAVGDTVSPVVRAIDAQGHVREDAACSWITRNPAVVEVVGVGELTGVAAGEAKVEIATGSVRVVLKVLVVPRPAVDVRIVAERLRIECGEAIALRVDAVDDRGAPVLTPRVTWRSDATRVLHVDPAGIALGLTSGAATIFAVVDGVRGTIQLVVTDPPIGSIEMLVEPLDLEPGDVARLTLHVVDTAGRPQSDDGVTVESDDERVLQVLADRHTLTAVAPGTARITARAPATQHSETVPTAFVVVAVRRRTVARVQVTPASLDLEVGAVVALSARCFDARKRPLPEQLLSWVSLDPAVVTVDSRGHVRARASGVTTIRVETVDPQDQTHATDIAVVDRRASIASLRLNAGRARVVVGEQLAVDVAMTDSMGAVVSEGGPTWSSSDPQIARVSAEGVVEGVARGHVTISAQCDGQRAEVTVGVDAVPLAAIHITSADSRAVVAERLQCQAIATDVRGNTQTVDVRWSVFPASSATISADGMLLAEVHGPLHVIAEGSGVRGTLDLEVLPPVIARLEVNPHHLKLRVGARATAQARALRHDDRAINGIEFAWSSSDPASVAVGPNGTISAVGPGRAIVRVTAGDQLAEIEVVVPPPAARTNRTYLLIGGGATVLAIAAYFGARSIASVVATPGAEGIEILSPLPPDSTLLVGSRLQLEAVLRSRRTPVAGVRWTVSDTQVAAIDDRGLLAARGEGSVRVSALAPGDSIAVATINVVLKKEPRKVDSIGTAREDSARRVREASLAKAREDSTRKAREASLVKAREDSTRKAREASLVKAREDSTRKAREASLVKAREDSIGKAREASLAKAREDSIRKAREASITKAKEDSSTKLREDSVKEISRGAVQPAVDRFVESVRGGENRSGALADFLGKGSEHRVSQLGSPRVVGDGSPVSVELTLALYRINPVGSPENRRVDLTLQGVGTGASFALRLVKTGALVRAPATRQ